MRDPRNEFEAWQSLSAAPALQRPATPAPAPTGWWRAPVVALVVCVTLALAYWVQA